MSAVKTDFARAGKRRVPKVGLCALLVVLLAGPVSGMIPARAHVSSDQSPWPGIEHPQHEAGSGLGQGRWRVGGYIQPQWEFIENTPLNSQDRDGFAMGQACLLGRGELQVHRRFEVALRYNFDLRSGALEARDLYGSVSFDDGLIALDVGRVRVPFTVATLLSEARYQLSDATQLVRLGYDRDLGARLRGRVRVDAVSFDGYLSAFNGEGRGANQDERYLYVGRLEMGPLGPVSPGEPDLDDSDLRFSLGGSVAHTRSIARLGGAADEFQARELRTAVDLRLKVRGLSFRAEYVAGSVDQLASSPRESFDRRGFSVQAGWVLPLDWGPSIEIVGRWDRVETDDGHDGFTGADRGPADYTQPDLAEQERFEAGLNAYFVGHRFKSMLTWRRTRRREGLERERGQGALVGDAFIAQLQLGWL